MPETTRPCVYFGEAGPANTARVLELARDRAKSLGVRHVVVPSTSGQTGALAANALRDLNVVVVTHSTGFDAPNEQRLEPVHRRAILEADAQILTCQHALGGVGRAIRRKLGTYQVDEVIAFTLRCFGQGVKVALEITAMAADAGMVPVGEEIVALGGTGKGIDTGVVVLAANAQDFFDLRALEIFCQPRPRAKP